MLTSIFNIIIFAAVDAAGPQRYDARPFAKALRPRQASTSATGLEVDLGYSVYRGTANASTNLNVFQG